MDQEAGDRVTQLTGCPPTCDHGPKMLWWKNEHPEVYGKGFEKGFDYVKLGYKTMEEIRAESMTRNAQKHPAPKAESASEVKPAKNRK